MKKNCPYCGEEIMATAQKCRHCGEWLPMEQQIGKPFPNNKISTQANVAESRKELPNAGMLQLACWITMALEIIQVFQVNTITSPRSHLLSIIFGFFADHIPDWIVVIALGVLWCILIMGLRTYCQIRHIGKMPFVALICMMIGAYFLSLIECFVEDESVILGLLLFLLPFVITGSILEFIIGIKLHKSDFTRRLGVWFMIFATIPLVSMIVELGLWSGDSQMILTGFINCAITIALLFELKKVFQK